MINRVAVLGAGTMGAQIALHFASAGFQVDLYDLPLDKKPLGRVQNALKQMQKLEPNSMANPAAMNLITAKCLDDLSDIANVDLIVEAVFEKLSIKKALFKKLAKHLDKNTIIASNTSGLSVNELAQCVPTKFRKQFMGIHFFNPPRYLPLVELIPAKGTQEKCLDQVETFLVRYLGKSVVRAKDTPNFIANRIGIFSLLSVIHYTKQFDIPLEVADELTGKLLGRPKSATYRTADIVGLDIMQHAVSTMQSKLKDDSFHHLFKLPTWVNGLIKDGALGQKAKKGFYEKRKNGIFVYDIQKKAYRKSEHQPNQEVLDILKEKDWKKRFKALAKSDNPQAQFVWALFKDLFLYIAKVSPEIADKSSDIDAAIRDGYGWKQGPFEIWQAAGWQNVIDLIDEKMPAWAKKNPAYRGTKPYHFKTKKFAQPKLLPVYERQKVGPSKTVFEDEVVRVWHQNDGIAVLSFKTKMCTISEQVLDGIFKAIEIAEANYDALVVWQEGSDHFSAGADLMEAGEKFLMEGPEALEAMLVKFQNATMALRYAKIPTVAAVRGFAFGGGCEVQMHCDAVVAAVESYIGLVELAVGLIPGAGGSKEFARRAAYAQNPQDALNDIYRKVAMAEVGKGAFYAQEMGFLRPTDQIVFNPNEIFQLAKQKARLLADANYRPPVPEKFVVQGREGRALIRMLLINMREGQFISEYDYFLADQLAYIMCGGDVDQGSLVDEAWILRLEREVFLDLVERAETFERIDHMLKTGKPLRN